MYIESGMQGLRARAEAVFLPLKGKAGKEADGKKRGERQTKETTRSAAKYAAKYAAKCHRVPDAHNAASNNKREGVTDKAEGGIWRDSGVAF